MDIGLEQFIARFVQPALDGDVPFTLKDGWLITETTCAYVGPEFSVEKWNQ